MNVRVSWGVQLGLWFPLTEDQVKQCQKLANDATDEKKISFNGGNPVYVSPSTPSGYGVSKSVFYKLKKNADGYYLPPPNKLELDQ
jgi:hypothetical protein